MNIIFLDVDGVLNSIKNSVKEYNKTHIRRSGYSYPFYENCLKNLKRLITETNSKLVISSTWRKNITGINTLLSKLKEYDLDNLVLGYTPILNSTKVKEIKAFIATLDFNPNFIILDDHSNMNDLLPHLIQTDPYVGLTIQNVEKAIRKLCN